MLLFTFHHRQSTQEFTGYHGVSTLATAWMSDQRSSTSVIWNHSSKLEPMSGIKLPCAQSREKQQKGSKCCEPKNSTKALPIPAVHSSLSVSSPAAAPSHVCLADGHSACSSWLLTAIAIYERRSVARSSPSTTPPNSCRRLHVCLRALIWKIIFVSLLFFLKYFVNAEISSLKWVKLLQVWNSPMVRICDW